jgi:hypothetical protein
MKKRVYVETSVISYLTSRISRDLIVAAHQQITQDWWDNDRGQFALYISELVIQEGRVGDSAVVKKRMTMLQELPRLTVNNHVLALARTIMDSKILPPKAIDDATHIAIATVHQMDYLLTWNCKHIANAQIQKAIETICHQYDYEKPTVCTPEELKRGE